MIDLDLFLQKLLIQGVELWAEEERLQVRPPQGGLSPEAVALLSQYESEILRLLPTFSFEMPLSYGQEALWFVHQNRPDKVVYNTGLVLHLQSAVDKALLRNVFQKIGQRHAALRTTIAVSNGQPKQVIHATQALYFEEVDCSSQSMSRGARELRDSKMVMQAVEEAYQRPFDLSEGPLWHVTLVTQSPDSHALLLSFHHTIIDGWSLWMLLDEFLALYAAGAAYRAVNLPPITGTYAQFVPWQREMLDTHGERLRAYWQEALGSGELPVLDLPTDYPRPKVPTSQTGNLPFHLSSDLRDQLRALARREGVSFYTVLLAAFQLLLARYSSAERILVGVPTAGRERKEFAHTFGYFVNPIVVDATLTNVPFTTFLSQVRAKLLAAIEHRAYPFPWLVKDLQIERDPSRGPIFQAILVVQRPQKLAEETVRLLKGEQVQLATANDVPDLLLEIEGWKQTTGESDIIFDLSEQTAPRGLGGHIRYKTDIFDVTTIERMGQHYQQLLEAIVSDATEGIHQLPLLTEVERHQILIEWNDTTTDYPRDKCIHDLFAEQAERTPDAIAVVFGEDSLTYRALNSKANQLAHHLQSLGVGREVLVGIMVERGIEMVVGLLGILKAGGAYVPLDPTYPAERLAFMLQDAGVSLLLTQDQLLERLPATTASLLCLDGDWNKIAHESASAPPSQVTAEELALVIYTSGSTGRPKGVEALHRGIMNRCHWMWRELPFLPGEVACQKTALSFVDSVWEIFGPLLRGVPLIIIADWVVRDPQALITQLATNHVSRLLLVPSLLKVILESDVNLHSRLPHLRTWICSGEALNGELAELFYARLPHARLLNLYGSSEVAGDVTWFDVSAPRKNGSAGVPIGRPIDNTQIYLLDAQLQPVPLGVAGGLYVGGDNLARGYVKQPKLTDARFIPNPYGRGKLFRTGDLARWLPDGNIEYLGRLDHQVKIRGFRIELGEIESVLRQHPTIQETVVVARDSGQHKELVAYVAPFESASDVDLIPVLRTHLKQTLPDYMVPAAFVLLDHLPLTPNGKIDRKALPAPERGGDEASYIPPSTPTEELLVAIWAEVLGIERVGIHDNFFELGGHSLLVTQVTSRVASTFGLDLPLRALFESPTIAQLAERIKNAQLVLDFQGMSRKTKDQSATFSNGSSSSMAIEEQEEEEEFVL